jgi:uncharacterized protein
MKKSFPCPNCKKATNLGSDNVWRPFCSERCRMIDLGDWMNENNKIASEQTDFFDMDANDDDIRH